MRILYYSVHQILEDDEVRLMQALGHDVCCLGSSSPAGAIHQFRPAIPFSERESALYRAFAERGGVYVYGGSVDAHRMPAEAIDLFDAIIVMHDPTFIAKHWQTLSRRPVVWRTIGQGVEFLDTHMAPFREQGMKIVRYSPVEAEASTHIGADALIRFFKSPDDYGSWRGDKGCVLSFSNAYRQRYPNDTEDFVRIVDGLPVTLGGVGNDGLPGAIGFTTSMEQNELYRQSRAYLYAHGLDIPYTLNFIEAWMTGIPVVVHAPLDRRGPYLEIDRLITDGIDGFICRDVAATRERLQALLDDQDLAQRIGKAGRERAMDHFSVERARVEWADFLARL